MQDEFGNPIDPNQAQLNAFRALEEQPLEVPIEEAPQEPVNEIDPRLQEALAKRDKQRMLADLLGGFQQLTQASAHGSGYKADMSMADKLAKRAEEPIDQYKEQLKSESAEKKEARATEQHEQAMSLGKVKLGKMELDLTDQKKTSDPTSLESKIARQEYAKILTEAGEPIPPDLDGWSAKQIHDLDERFRKKTEQLLKFSNQEKLKGISQKHATSERLGRQEFEASQSDKADASKIEAERIKADAKIKKDLDKESKAKDKVTNKELERVRTENRKTRTELDSAQKTAEAGLVQLKKIKEQFDTYSANAKGGTGPLATAFGLKKYFDQKTESLDSSFKKMGLDIMVKMFAGMSKAVDSDAERRAFESTIPNIKLDDKTNIKLLNDRIQAAEALISKSKVAKSRYDKYGEFREKVEPEVQQTEDQQAAAPYGDVFEKNGKTYKWNPTVGKYQLKVE